jgi:hypothetical protein
MDNIYRYECLRCRHVWASKKERPRVCPKCKTPYWDTLPKTEIKPINVFSKKWERLHKEKIKKNKWGRWKYNPATHCLEIVKHVGGHIFSYEVDLNRCNTGAKLLDWIYQVQGKSDISPDDVADLIYAVDDILDVVQSKLCSMGKNLNFDVNKYLTENVDPLFRKVEDAKTAI